VEACGNGSEFRGFQMTEERCSFVHGLYNVSGFADGKIDTLPLAKLLPTCHSSMTLVDASAQSSTSTCEPRVAIYLVYCSTPTIDDDARNKHVLL
jgi:hypothetical protein